MTISIKDLSIADLLALMDHFQASLKRKNPRQDDIRLLYQKAHDELNERLECILLTEKKQC